MDSQYKYPTRSPSRPMGPAIFATLLLLAGTGVQAAVIETVQADWGKGNGNNSVCCDAGFNVSFDQVSAAGKGGGSVAHSFADNVPQNFTLSHSGVTGDLIFTIGNSAPLTLDLTELTGWDTIGLLASVGGEKTNVLSISNLQLVSPGTGTYNFTNGLNLTGNQNGSQAILLTEGANPFFFNNFTLTGTLVFDWGSKAPKSGDLDFRVGVAGQTVVPIPAAAWLFASALVGLASMQRRRRSA